jgi:hypothetical protein
MSQGPYNIDYALYSQFERLGHPGRYITSRQYTSGQLDLTGSNYGYGALMVVTAGGATASLSGGGEIGLNDLTAKTIYDISLSKITGGSGSVIYVFKRQGM